MLGWWFQFYFINFTISSFLPTWLRRTNKKCKYLLGEIECHDTTLKVDFKFNLISQNQSVCNIKFVFHEIIGSRLLTLNVSVSVILEKQLEAFLGP